MRIKIALDTYHSAVALATIAAKLDSKITITDGNGLRANAKSVIGVLSAMEYGELWLESDDDHYFAFKQFSME